MFCIKCGKQIEGSRFCPFCGAEQVSAAQPAQGVQQTGAVPPQGTVPPQGVAQPQSAVQPQVVYVAQPQPAPQPAKEAPKKKKFPVALLVIGIIAAVLLFLLVIVIVVIILIAVIGGKAIGNIFGNSGGGGSSNTVISSLIDELDLEGNDYDQNGFPNAYDGDGYDNVYNGNITDIPQGIDPGQGYIGYYVGEPSLSDFDWYDTYRETKYPSGDVRWLDSSEYVGQWKGYIRYSESQEELTYMSIAITPEYASLLVDWYAMSDGYALEPETDMEDTPYFGYEWGAGIHVEGTGIIELTEFWEEGGRQYGVGTLTTATGTTYEIALVRP